MTTIERILELKRSNRPFWVHLSDGKELEIRGGEWIGVEEKEAGIEGRHQDDVIACAVELPICFVREPCRVQRDSANGNARRGFSGRITTNGNSHYAIPTALSIAQSRFPRKSRRLLQQPVDKLFRLRRIGY